MVQVLVRGIEDVGDLEGLTVKVVKAGEDELVIEVPGGKRYRVYPDIDCGFWDGDVCADPDYTLLLNIDEEGE